jgi:hypothetical protein
MNCKPNQLAWVKVPRQFHGSGLEQLNNHVVKTVCLVPGYPEPTWQISPPQTVKFTSFSIDHSGRRILPGEVMWTDTLPDSMLRPFDPDSEPLNEPASRELEHTA